MRDQHNEEQIQQIPQKYWIPEKYDEIKIPLEVEQIRKRRQNLLKESRVTELTKKYQFDKYAFSRLTDNEIFYHVRIYLAIFHINKFRNYKIKSKISEEIWLRNEGLPTGEGLFQLYSKERGYNVEGVVDDLNMLLGG